MMIPWLGVQKLCPGESMSDVWSAKHFHCLDSQSLNGSIDGYVWHRVDHGVFQTQEDCSCLWFQYSFRFSATPRIWYVGISLTTAYMHVSNLWGIFPFIIFDGRLILPLGSAHGHHKFSTFHMFFKWLLDIPGEIFVLVASLGNLIFVGLISTGIRTHFLHS